MDIDLDDVKLSRELQQELIQHTVKEIEEANKEEEGQVEGVMANNPHQKEEMLSPLLTEKKPQLELMMKCSLKQMWVRMKWSAIENFNKD
jgi:CelD/BcsL family acetyltransferase involved in cellulose biosynthesis